MNSEQLRILHQARQLQAELRWAYRILKNARLDGSRLFIDVSILARFIQILCGQSLPVGLYFDRSLPAVTTVRNILNFLHRFGIRTGDINAVDLINGSDSDRYKLLFRLHERFDCPTFRRDIGLLTVDTGHCNDYNSSSHLAHSGNSEFFKIPTFSFKAATTLAAELRAIEPTDQTYIKQTALRNARSASISHHLNEIHKLCQEIGSEDSTSPSNGILSSPNTCNADVLSHISLQLGSVTTSLSRIDNKLGTLCGQVKQDKLDAPRMTYSRGGFFGDVLGCATCLKSTTLSPVKIGLKESRSAKVAMNPSRLFTTV